MPTPKDFLKAQAGVLSRLPDPISPQIAASLIKMTETLPDVPGGPALGGQSLGPLGALSLPQLPMFAGATPAGLPSLPGASGAGGPIEFLQSVESAVPAGLPKFASLATNGFRSIESKPGGGAITGSRGVQGSGYRSV